MLKGRFQYLKRCRIVIRNKNSMIRLMRYIVSACILHNLLINDKIPNEWIEEEDSEHAVLEPDDELNQPMDYWHINDDTRRSQIFAYVLEKCGY